MISLLKSILKHGYFGIIVVAFGIVMIVVSFATTHTSWPSTEAIVVRVEVTPNSTGNSDYTYTPYVSYDISLTEHYDNIRLDTYISGITEEGKIITIRYNPSNHSEITYYYESVYSSMPFIIGNVLVIIGLAVAYISGRIHLELTPIKE